MGEWFDTRYSAVSTFLCVNKTDVNWKRYLFCSRALLRREVTMQGFNRWRFTRAKLFYSTKFINCIMGYLWNGCSAEIDGCGVLRMLITSLIWCYLYNFCFIYVYVYFVCLSSFEAWCSLFTRMSFGRWLFVPNSISRIMFGLNRCLVDWAVWPNKW